MAEYLPFDPTGDYLKPRLQGERLQAGKYERMLLQEDRLFSAALGLELIVVGENLRFFDPVQEQWLLTYTEADTQRLAESRRANTEAQRADAAMRQLEAEAQRAESEAQRANNAEAENARLRAELEALRQRK